MVTRRPVSPPEPGNEEVVRRVFAAFARRDLDAALEWMHPQVRIWVVTAAVTRGGRPYVGHEGVREYLRDVQRLWHELVLVPLRFEQAGPAVVVLGEVRARGAAGALRRPAVWTWKLVDGLVIECRVDSDLSAAREALGEAQTVEAILRAWHDAFNRRDVDALVGLADPEIIIHPALSFRSQREYTGHHGLESWIGDLRAADQDHVVRAREVRRIEEEQWAVLGQLLVAEEPISPFASFVRLSEGRVREAREFLSEESILRELRYLP